MIVIYINSEGTAQKVSPSHVYQGSNQSGVLVFAPVPTTTALSIAFKLPDGTNTPYYPMTPIQQKEYGIMQYEFKIGSSLTQEAGQASIALQAVFTNGQQTSQLVQIEIEPSVLPSLPDEIDEDAYTLIMQYLQQDRTDITALQGQIDDIEATADSAEKASAQAVETANEAKTTADGLADSIAQANANASQAVDTANKAETTANGLADSIAQANETAESAVNTANGAVEDIEEYKNQINSDVEGLREDINKSQFFKGMFNTVEELKATYPTATENDYAYIIAGNQWIYTNGEWTDSGVPTPNTTVPRSTSIPLMDGEGSAGTATAYASGDHRHPSDTNKVNKAGDKMTGELDNMYSQKTRGYKTVAVGAWLVIERGGFNENGYEIYSRYIVAGEGGDKFCFGWNYNNFPCIPIKVYNSGNLQVDGVVPYIESNKLAPTTANGWTVGDKSLSLPSSYGLYLLSISTTGAPKPFFGLVIYNSDNQYFAGVLGSSNYPTAGISRRTSEGWLLYMSDVYGNTSIVTAVAYKKLA